MNKRDNKPWPQDLYNLFKDSTSNDRDVVEFIKTTLPDTEGRLFDAKGELYLRLPDSEDEQKQRAKIIKTVSALANVVDRSPYRFLLIGFQEDGTFDGIQKRGPAGGDHIIDTDEAELQQLLIDYLEPAPDVERYEINQNNKCGLVLVIQPVKEPPSVVENNIRIKGGTKSLITEGQVFTRKGSRNTRMGNDEFRNLVDRREQILLDKIEQFADDLAQVAGLSPEQLENATLAVSPSDDEDAFPLREVITTDPARDVNEKLKIAVKNWRSTGDLASSLNTVYQYYDHRQELDLTNQDGERLDKAEYLIQSSIIHYLPGTEWILKYDGDEERVYRSVLDQVDGNNLQMIEHVLLVRGKKEILEEIQDDPRLDYHSSNAADYKELCDRSPESRLREYGAILTGVSIGQSEYSLEELLSGGTDIESLIDDAVKKGRQTQPKNTKSTLRKLELIRLTQQTPN
ncbi:AlbA family DNA-binding domain-containing protein [Halostella salina]|uniref:AlbA family DNA-binding domain-containing protein n=1 Tax=Halostella salina TaxID=1547897 RepID=UPI000EF7B57D|nr:ATP-binding protein [Halostella salina]